jgi:hypothetical protein
VLDRLYILSPWAAYGLSIAAMLAAAEFGRSIGVWWDRRHHEALSANISILVGAALGLLSLMIGFTFSMTLTRFDARLSGVVNEANAIGTTALRARMLPEPHAAEVIKLLRDYVQLRLDARRITASAASLEQMIARSGELQAELWQHAAAVSAAEPRSVPVGLFVQTLNQMIDLQEIRLAAGRNRVPVAVFLLLYAVAVVALGFGGYIGGLSGGREGRIPIAIMAVMIATVIAAVGDLDRSQGGFITVDQQAMENLKKSLDR